MRFLRHRVIDGAAETTHREQHDRFCCANRDERCEWGCTRYERGRRQSAQGLVADNHAPGARAVAGIVQELVVQIVDRIGVVIVKVKPFGHEQPFGICKIGVRREAGVRMPYRDARAWLATVEERPRVDDVRVLKTPLEVTGGGRIIASARCAGRRRLLHICNVAC